MNLDKTRSCWHVCEGVCGLALDRLSFSDFCHLVPFVRGFEDAPNFFWCSLTLAPYYIPLDTRRRGV
jgi:hypothetical protein